MIKTIYWYLYFLMRILDKYFVEIRLSKLEKQGKFTELDEIIDQETRKWSQGLINIAGVTVNVTGNENIPEEGPVVLVSNHQSMFDIPILLGYVDRRKAFIAKVELKKFPILNKWMERMRCVFIDRKNIRKGAEAINTGIQYLKNGDCMVIFPEGTRSRDGKLLEFKHGSFKLATKSQATIVPIAIQGTYKVLEQNKGIIKPSEVDITIFKSISTKDLTREQITVLPEMVRNIINEKFK